MDPWKLESSTNRKTKMEQTFFRDLPCDLLQSVMSLLPLKDNIRASSVCKTWHKACVSVRVVDQSPWLIYFSKTESSYEFHDPSSQKTYKLEFPELSGYRVCYSKDGWLLMYNANSHQLLFFNPFTRDRIPLPSLFMAYDQRIAFSCAPTSSNCVLFTIIHVGPTFVFMKTCCPDSEEWTTFEFRNTWGSCKIVKQIVFSNGVFYLITSVGDLSMFKPGLNTWKVVPGVTFGDFRSNGWFMTEYNGEIFVVYMYDHKSPTVLKLDHTRYEWTTRKSLGGLTIYASALSSVTRAEQPSGIRNCLCLSVFRGFKRTCIYNKVDDEAGECVSLKVKKRDPYENIWIMPPVNLLELSLFD